MATSKVKKLVKLCMFGGLSCILLLVFAIAGFMLLREKPPAMPETVSSVGDIETYLDELVAFGTPPGLSLVVVRNGDVVYSKGFGVADGPGKIDAAPETVYRWWSMTKVFTAVAIMQLHEKEKLDLDDLVEDHLDFLDLEYTSENDEKVTIRHLLNHSSGIPDNVPEVMGWMHLEEERGQTETEFLKSVVADYTELKFSPGTSSEYTNVGYMVLGAVIEEVSGVRYEDYMVENILSPLGMNHTNFSYSEDMDAVAAAGSHPLIRWETPLLPFLFDDWKAFIRETEDQRIWFNRFYADSNPPTGLIGSTEDLARFLSAMLDGGEYGGQRILSAETVAAMLSENIVPATDTGQIDAEFQGLGWEVTKVGGKVEFLAHGGGGPGFGCAMRIYPGRNLAMAVLANDTTYDSVGIMDLVAQLEWEDVSSDAE